MRNHDDSLHPGDGISCALNAHMYLFRLALAFTLLTFIPTQVSGKNVPKVKSAPAKAQAKMRSKSRVVRKRATTDLKQSQHSHHATEGKLSVLPISKLPTTGRTNNRKKATYDLQLSSKKTADDFFRKVATREYQEQIQTRGIVRMDAGERGDVWVVSPGNTSKATPAVKNSITKILNSYWRRITTNYKRLKLSNTELAQLLRSGRSKRNRTTFIVTTDKGSNKFRSGVSVVYSRSVVETLPLEDFINKGQKGGNLFSLERSSSKIAEIKGLISPTGAPFKGPELIKQIMGVAAADKEVGRIYFITSKRLERYYVRTGIPMKVYEKYKDSRDVLLEIDANAMRRHYAEQQ